MIDNKGINKKYFLLLKKDPLIIVGFCSNSCAGKFRRNPRAYLAKVPGMDAPGMKSSGMKRGSSARAPAVAVGKKAWKGPCEVKKIVKGHYCHDCKRELEPTDTRNGICKRCEKEPQKIDFCAATSEPFFRAACHPEKISDKPFRC